MKHLKTFLESLFTTEPTKLNQNDFYSQINKREFVGYSKEEKSQLVNLLESNGYWDVTSKDPSERHKSSNFYEILHSNFKFSIPWSRFIPIRNNEERVYFTLINTDDEWFYVQIHQDDIWDEDTDEITEGFAEYWELDGFDTVIPFLKSKCNFN